MKPLPKRLELKPAESLASFVHRLAEVNGQNSIEYLSKAMGLTSARVNNNEFDEGSIIELANLSGHNLDELKRRSSSELVRLIGSGAYQKYVLKNRVKYCPVCIRVERFHQFHWFLQPLNVCMTHHVELVEHCLACGSKVPMKTLMRGECALCGNSLQAVEPLKISTSSVLFNSQADLFRKLFNQLYCCNFTKTPEQYFKLVHHSLQLLAGLPSYIDDDPVTIIAFHNKSGRTRSGSALALAFANVYWMYRNFPINFDRVLHDFFTQNQHQIRYMKKAAFEQLFEDPNFDGIYATYKTFWLKKSDEGLIRVDFSLFKKEPGLLAYRQFIRKDEVKSVTGISYPMIEKMEQMNNLKILTLPERKYLVNKNSLESVYSERNSFVTKKEAGLILGISSGTVTALIHVGFLKPIKKESQRYELLSLQEVTELMERYRGRLIDRPCGLLFEQVLRKFNHLGLSVTLLLQYYDAGLISVFTVKENGSLRDNYYEPNDLYVLHKTFTDKNKSG